MIRPRVALIDDDVTLVSLLCQLFDMEGWVVIPCSDGAQALSSIEVARPDVVLLDVQLDTPERGWEILRAMRASDWGRTIPVVVCSSLAVIAQRPEMLELGRVSFVSKPFDLDHLIATVTRSVQAEPVTGSAAF